MSFTVANNGFLRLGGASQTAPTTHLSASSFLATGIPQNADKTRFADITTNDTNGHAIKTVVIRIVSSAGATQGAGAFRHNAGLFGAGDPDATHGSRVAVGEIIEIPNCREVIFNFSGQNLSGGNMEIDVEVYE